MKDLSSRRIFQEVPQEPVPYYWHKDRSNWCVIKPNDEQDTVNFVENPSFEANTLNGWGANPGGPNVVLNPFNQAAYGHISMHVGQPGLPAGADAGVNYGSTGAWASTFPPIVAQPDMYGCVSIRGTRGQKAAVSFFSDGPPPVGYLPDVLDYVELTGEWQTICHRYHASPQSITNGLQLGLRVEVDTTNTPDVQFDVDGVTVTNVPTSRYFDGDSEDAFWVGTPHASQSQLLRFAVGYGEKISFADLGLDIYSDEGFGHAPVENITTQFARLDGAHLQRQHLLPRTITLTGVINACDDPFQIHQKRRQIIEALTYRYKRQCAQELILCYEMADDCGNTISSELQIPVIYENGLGGIRRHQYEERMALQLTAYRQPWFSDPFEKTQALTVVPDGGTPNTGPNQNANIVIEYDGSEDAWPRIEIATLRDAPVAPLVFNFIENKSTGHRITMGVPTVGITIPVGQRLIIDTTPGQTSAFLDNLPGLAAPGLPLNVTNQINWPLSDIGLFRFVPGSNIMHAETSNGNSTSGGEFGNFYSAVAIWHENHISIDYVKPLGTCNYKYGS